MAESKLTFKNPRRILLVGNSGSGKLSLLKSLTGSLPTNLESAGTHAGLSHTLSLKNSYYEVDIPIWIDEIPKTTAEEWATGYKGAEAKEVLNVIGAFIFTFRKPQNKDGLEHIKKVLKSLHEVVKSCGYMWDGVCLAIAMPQNLQPRLEMTFDEWEDIAREFQFEYIDSEGTGLNEHGEAAGIERVKEALEANDWGSSDDLDDGVSFGSFEDEDANGESGPDPLKPIEDEMQREMFGLHSAIMKAGDDNSEDDEELRVENLEAAMMKLQAIKDLGPEEVTMKEKQRLAKSVVRDIMES